MENLKAGPKNWAALDCLRCPKPSTLTGEGKLRQGHVTVHAVIDEADAYALSLDLHSRDVWRLHGPWAVSTAGGQGQGLQRLCILEQPTCCLLQLAFKKIRGEQSHHYPKLYKDLRVRIGEWGQNIAGILLLSKQRKLPPACTPSIQVD